MMIKKFVIVLISVVLFSACKKAPCPAYTKTATEENLVKE
jgi:hypothetical protein